MKSKINQIFLLIVYLLIKNNIANAEITSPEAVTTKEEYRLMIDYRKKTCPFIDKNTDYGTKNDCFHIANRLYELTQNKAFLYSIAEHYFKGYGVTQNYKRGLKLMEELANSNHEYAIKAQAALGIYYGADDSPKLVKNPIKADYWTKKAAENEDSFSQCRYATILLKNKKKFNDAIYWYKKAAFNESLDAKYKLGVLFNEGYSVQVSKEQIYKFLYEAAAEDYAPAFEELCLLYKKDGDFERAKFWYNKFVGSDFYKKVEAGMDPVDAIIEIFKEKKKKAYMEEVKKEMEKIEKQIKPNEGEY